MQKRRFTLSAQTTLQLGILLCLLLAWLQLTGCAGLTTVPPSPDETVLPVRDASDMPLAIHDLMRQADQQYRNKEYQASLVTLERAIRIKPRQPEIWSRMAMACSQLGQYSKALQYARRSNRFSQDNNQLKQFNNRLIDAASAGSRFE